MDKNFLEECLLKGMSTREIEKICDKDHRTISYWINKYNLSDMSKYRKNPSYKFGVIDTPEKAYVLGFILADGSIEKNNTVEVVTSMKDKCVVEYISWVVNSNVSYDYTFNKKARRFPRARMSKVIKDINMFVGGRLKKERHFPRIRADLEKYMLLGLFDADGCITWGRRKDRNRIWQKVSFTSQFKILEGTQKYLYRVLNISSVIKPKTGCNCFVLSFSDKDDVLKFCEHIYQDKDFIVLRRKYLKYKALRLELEENGEGKRTA